MKLSPEKPPCYERANKLWGVTMEDGVVFTYGDTCHTLLSKLPPWLEAHEIVHSHQQTNPKEWWDRYFIDPEFRLEQELEAYRAQYQWVLKNIKDKNQQNAFLHKFATDLSSTMYGNLLTRTQAFRRIKDPLYEAKIDKTDSQAEEIRR